jgi:hypothetical protein
MVLFVHCLNASARHHGVRVPYDDWIDRYGDVSAADIQERGRCLACGTGGASTRLLPVSSLMKGGDAGAVPEYRVEVPQGMCGRFTN